MSYTPLDESAGSAQLNGRIETAAHYDEEPSQPISPSSGEHRQSLSQPLTDDDPFYVFRDDLYRKLEIVDEALAEFLRIQHQSSSSLSKPNDFKHAKKQLKKHIKIAEAALRDVQLTVNVVERDRSKFSHISDYEFYERNAFCDTSRDRLDRAKEEVASVSSAVSSSSVRGSGGADSGVGGGHSTPASSSSTAAQQQSLMLQQHQDETLDELGMAVTRVNTIAENIHEEIGQQNKLLEEIEDDLANAEEELGLVMGKLAKFMKTKNQWQLGTILCLAATVVVLFFMVLYF